MTSKIPIYKDGEIVGVMGYIIDVDEARKNLGLDRDTSKTDELTGHGNAYSLVGSLIDYSIQYTISGQDFGLILLRNTKYERILETYGQSVSDSVLSSIADEIEDYIDNKGMIARTKESYFVVLTHCDSREELTGKAEELKKRIESITSVDGIGVTIKMASAVRMRSDPGMTDETLYVKALEELSDT